MANQTPKNQRQWHHDTKQEQPSTRRCSILNIPEGVTKKHSELEKNTTAGAKRQQKKNAGDEKEAKTRVLVLEEQEVVIRGSRYKWESSDVWDTPELCDQQLCKRGTGEGDLKDMAVDKS